VRYKVAGALVTVPASHAPTAIKAAAYIKLIVKESDNNVKLLVLRESPSLAKIMQEMVMNNLRPPGSLIPRTGGQEDLQVPWS